MLRIVSSLIIGTFFVSGTANADGYNTTEVVSPKSPTSSQLYRQTGIDVSGKKYLNFYLEGKIAEGMFKSLEGGNESTVEVGRPSEVSVNREQGNLLCQQFQRRNSIGSVTRILRSRCTLGLQDVKVSN